MRRVINLRSAGVLSFVLAATSACLPAHLQKYQRQTTSSPRDSAEPSAQAPAPRKSSGAGLFGFGGSDTTSAPGGKQATIYAVDPTTFRLSLRYEDVWNAALSVLLKNYTLLIVDEKSGVISTEWDSYYLNNQVYRNKMSILIRRTGWSGGLEMTVKNSVERLRDAREASASLGAVWLPAEDAATEVNRVVQNMALTLNQPPPVFSPTTPSQVAKGQPLPEPKGN